MKAQSLVVSGLFSSLLVLSLSLPVFSQTLNFWIGGAPGLEREWNCPKNWSAYKVPNEFSSVVIPDVSTGSRSYPVIYSGVLEIYSLDLTSNASLEIGNQATLIVYGEIHNPGKVILNPDGILIEWEEVNKSQASALPAKRKAGY
ncbi:MAG: hypothetical protein IPJ00_02375 [Saprospirales bacterium]|jgi:hypothetical protein|nr:hypothetical protein [Saprospirales bacterium]